MTDPSPSYRRFMPVLGLLLALVAVAVSFYYVLATRHRSRTDAASDQPRKVLRIAHSYNDVLVEQAFANLVRNYERLNPGVEVRVQAVPLRVYAQWIRTQFVGGNPPDIIEPLRAGGMWNEIASQHLWPLTSNVMEPNPHNRGTALEQVNWKDTYLNGMEGGYFLHLMEFYAVPFSMNGQRIFYNKSMFRKIFGHDRAPANYREWMQMGADIKAWAVVEQQKLVVPLALSRDDLLGGGGVYARYFRSLTAGMMARYDMQHWGSPNPTLVYWGLLNGTFRLQNARMKSAFEAVRRIGDICQPGFAGDLPDNKRFLFLQGRAAMVLGDTRDYSIYKSTPGLDVGVFNFPQIGVDDPEFGQYYEGPFWEGEGGTGLMLAITRESDNRGTALDFLQFASSLKENTDFCGLLSWFPVVKGVPVSGDLAAFSPQTQGVLNAPELVYPNSITETYFQQNLPLYLSGQMGYEALMQGIEEAWLVHGWRDVLRMLNMRVRSHRKAEYNITTSKARLLFGSAGDPAQEYIKGERTRYQLGLEIIEMLDSNMQRRRYIKKTLPEGRYRYPPPVAAEATAP